MKNSFRSGALCAFPLLVGLSCAASISSRSGSQALVTSDQLRARNQALNEFIVQALKPCTPKLKKEDAGLLIVTARPDGALSFGAMQWLGSDEAKQCFQEEIQKARLPAFAGPTVTWIWGIGTDEKRPRPLGEVPFSYRDKQRSYVMEAQGNSGLGNDISTGPMSACARRSLPPDSWALVNLRLFIFPDGKVVGVTPIGADGDGRSGDFLDCVAEIARSWKFDGFQGPSFTTLDVPLKYGVNPADK